MQAANSKTEFKPVPEQPDFPKMETETLQYWKDIDAFKTQLEKTKDCPPYTFYDGPPFATGLPHYGHICAGTIKDVVTRYAAQTGHYVERRFGWDCHGLPIEYEIDKAYGIRTRADVLEIGVDEYNKRCRAIVMKYATEWEEIVTRLGRWIDFKNDYKTMDLKFMESVWWVFKQMWDKGLVYRGAKVMPYSIGCSTVLSNFEAGQNFKEVNDASVFVGFPLIEEPTTKLVAWTTTPWTLPSNLALCVNKDLEYVKIKDKKTEETLVIAKVRLTELYKKPDGYQILETFKGSALEGKEYKPLFEYYAGRREQGAFRVFVGAHVTDDAGTGIVHTAPAFGADDYSICLKHGIIKPDSPPCPVDASGFFTEPVSDFAGQYIKDHATERAIIKNLKERGLLVHETQFNHSYPFCWRSETPLIYRAINSWFINVKGIKTDLLENNKKAYWVPSFAQEKRFHNWLENAEDWCFSRNRFWGNPIPIWASEDFEEMVCVGSIEELQKLSGVKNINDLHKEFVDKITIPSQKGKGVLRRIDEVFDCWFESGSMPYAQVHYPFSTTPEQFEKRFPADFIGEGLDQTRGWFYTLNVISTAVKNSNPYKNLIVNGMVLAADGKKMSKRLKNYPDPMEVVNSKGADAIRLYLMNSPLVRAETLNFNEKGVFEVVRKVFNPWYNVYRFLLQNITRWETKGDQERKFLFDNSLALNKEKLTNITDRWVIASNQHLIKFAREEMDAYRLYTVVPKLLRFLDALTNTYVRLNRGRLKGDNGDEDQKIALNVLFDVLLNVTILMSPFVPFITEMIYQNLVKCIHPDSHYYEQSIHFLRIPKFDPNLIDEKIERDVDLLMTILEDARVLREARKVSFKQPIKSLTVITDSEEFVERLQALAVYIQEEINVEEVLFEKEITKYVTYQLTPDHKVLGKQFGKTYNNDFRKALQNLTNDDARKFLNEGKLAVNGQELNGEHLSVKLLLKKEGLAENLELGGDTNVKVLLDLTQDENMRKRGTAREIVNRIQKLRKSSSLHPDDDVVIFVNFKENANALIAAFGENKAMMENILKKPFNLMEKKPQYLKVAASENFDYENEHFDVEVCWNNVALNKESIEAKYPGLYQEVEKAVAEANYHETLKSLKEQGKLSLNLSKPVELVKDQDFSVFAREATA